MKLIWFTFLNHIYSLAGSQKITPHNYEMMGAYALENNPPSCGIPYQDIDIRKITALQSMNKAQDCYKCIKVSNAEKLGKFIYVLAVDTGGQGLDLSSWSFNKLFNQTTDPSWASWNDVDPKFCTGIIKNNEDWYKNNSTLNYVDDTAVYEDSDQENIDEFKSNTPNDIIYNNTSFNNFTNPNSTFFNWTYGKWFKNHESGLTINFYLFIVFLFY